MALTNLARAAPLPCAQVVRKERPRKVWAPALARNAARVASARRQTEATGQLCGRVALLAGNPTQLKPPQPLTAAFSPARNAPPYWRLAHVASFAHVNRYSNQTGLAEAASCAPCPTAMYCVRGSVVATLCPAGFLGGNDGHATFECNGLCPRGHWCPQGATYARPCEPLLVTPWRAPMLSRRCPRCAPAGVAGRFNQQKGRPDESSCLDAIPGHYSTAGSSVLIGCPAGRYGGSVGLPNENCSGECPLGHYCPAASITPLLCPDGTFGARVGLRAAAQCTVCELGYVCISGKRTPCRRDSYGVRPASKSLLDCVSCPFHSVSHEGATSLNDCRCVPDRYAARQNDGTFRCLRAPAGSNCSDNGTRLETMPLLSGYWRISRESSDVRRCPDAFKANGSGCVGGSGDPCFTGLNGILCQSAPLASWDLTVTECSLRPLLRARSTPDASICCTMRASTVTRYDPTFFYPLTTFQLASTTKRTTLVSTLAASLARASRAGPIFGCSWA